MIIRPAHLKGQGQCIFCGGTGLSKEHIFGDWLKAFFPRDETTTHTSAHISWPKNVITKQPMDLRRKKQGHSGTLKLRVVCRRCNNGWLSALEGTAKEVLPCLIVGNCWGVLPEGQMKLAVWATKTAMVASNFRPRITEITQEERRFLMDKGVPPHNWFVWIAAYQGRDWHHLTIFQDRGGLSPTPLPSPDLTPHYVQATTFGVGRILFLVLSGSSPQIEPRFTGRDWPGVLQIWPPQPRSIPWPPARILGDEEANVLANILRSSGAFDHSFDPAANWTFSF